MTNKDLKMDFKKNANFFDLCPFFNCSLMHFYCVFYWNKMNFKAVNSFLFGPGYICEERTTGKKAKTKSLKVRVRLPIGHHDVRTYIFWTITRTAGGLRAPPPPRLCVT